VSAVGTGPSMVQRRLGEVRVGEEIEPVAFPITVCRNSPVRSGHSGNYCGTVTTWVF
jgi:hypothetical protein